MKLSTPT